MTGPATQVGLLTNTVLFCRALREQGLVVTPAEAVDAIRTVGLIDANDREETFLSLRSVLTSRVEEFPVFEELFEVFWVRLAGTPQPWKVVERETESSLKQRVRPSSPPSERKELGFFLEHWAEASSNDAEPINVPLASSAESNAEKDLRRLGSNDLEEIARVARRIVKKLASRPSRRWKPVRRGTRVNLRRSLRNSLKTGGELIDLSFRRRKQKKTRLVVICDVSGSMDLYSRLFLQFVYGLQNSFARVETFVFSTSLQRITGHLKNRAYEQALDSLSANVRGWSGGTLIGQSIATFNSVWPTLVDRRTIVVILSDGWDTGEPDELASSLGSLKRRAGRLIWLNPLLGSATYQPLTRGMQAALPHIDVFAPLHDLASLRALEPHLVL
ncbi:MAG TPA: VWA domain-containing protein [Blastocatellia bacterium]|nr:VWA domain-containing protein [Blastocatellia bacterium]